MPRKSRIDAPGALHHIMARGIEKGLIFQNDSDRDHFLNRLGEILTDTKTTCYAWSLMPNHFHLLLRTGTVPVSTVMRRLLTGYAIWHNRSHRRNGHLFQNRYKSILCQEDAYLLELVRYIHLNPIRAGIVENLAALDRYSYCGHGVLMNNVDHPWQETKEVLIFFDQKTGQARRSYRRFVEKGVAQGRRDDLSGGGLIRSMGGWTEVKRVRKAKIFEKSDERILGDGDFVESILAAAEETMERKYALRSKGFTIEKVAARVSKVLGIEISDVWALGRYRRSVESRSLLCYWAVRELGMPMSSLSRRLNLSIPGVSKSVKRGEALAKAKGYVLIEK